MITREQFIKEMKEVLTDFYDVEVKSTKRINCGEQETLAVIPKGEGREKIWPVLEIDDLFQEYKNGRSIRAIAGDISDFMQGDKKQFDDVVKEIKNFDEKKIQLRLLNKKKNINFLTDVPHFEMLDLAIVFNIDVGIGSVIVTNRLFEQWDMSKDELYDIAYKNLISTRYFFGGVGSLAPFRGNEDMISPMIAISNKEWLFGSNVLLNTDYLSKITDVIQCSLYIIPSSVHEILVLPAFSKEEGTEMRELIKHLNIELVKTGGLKKKEVLSDNLYHFDKYSKKLTIF